jgi:hypothetical protein
VLHSTAAKGRVQDGICQTRLLSALLLLSCTHKPPHAQIPATIKFALVGPPAAAAAAGRKGSLLLGRLGRRLLDCEKLIFDTDAQGAVQVRAGLCVGWSLQQLHDRGQDAFAGEARGVCSRKLRLISLNA